MPEWVYMWTGGVLALAGGALFAWALWWDRPRGRRRCPRCWYEMTGVPGLVCPECGGAASSERALFKIRRKRGMAALAVLPLCAGIGLRLMPAVRRDGWMGAVPTTVVIACLPRAGEEHERDSATGKWKENLFSVAMGQRVREGRVMGWQWRWALKRTEVFRTRQSWAAGDVIRAGIWPPRWLDGSIRAQALIEGGAPLRRWSGDSSGTYEQYQVARERFQVVGPLPPGRHRVRLAVEVGSSPPKGKALRGKKRTAAAGWKGTLSLPVRVIANEGGPPRPVSGEELDAAARQAIRLDLYQTGDRSYLLTFVDRNSAPELSGVSLGVLAELWCDGRLVETLQLGPYVRAYYGEQPIWYAVADVRTGLDPKDAERWRVRIQGDRAASLRDFDHEQYWSGAFEAPLSEALLHQ